MRFFDNAKIILISKTKLLRGDYYADRMDTRKF